MIPWVTVLLNFLPLDNKGLISSFKYHCHNSLSSPHQPSPWVPSRFHPLAAPMYFSAFVTAHSVSEHIKLHSDYLLLFHSWVEKIPWRREWQPTLVFLPGKSHGQRSLEGCSSWGHKRAEHDWTAKQVWRTFRWNYLDLVYIRLSYFCTNDSFNSTSLFPFSKPVCSVYKPVIYSLSVLPRETYKATSIMYSPQKPSASGSSCPGTYRLLPLSPGLKHLASFPGIGSFPLPSSGIYKEGKRAKRAPSASLLIYLDCPFFTDQK